MTLEQIDAYLCNREFCDAGYHTDPPTPLPGHLITSTDLEEFASFDNDSFFIPFNNPDKVGVEYRVAWRMVCGAWLLTAEKKKLTRCSECDLAWDDETPRFDRCNHYRASVS